MKYVSFLVVLFVGFNACQRSSPTNTPVDLPCSIDSAALTWFQQTQGITAALDANSIPLNNGSTLWMFGSCNHNDYDLSAGTVSCVKEFHNGAMLQQANGQMQTVNNSSDWIPSNETNTWFEPLHGYQYMDTLYVFARKVGGSASRTYIAKALMPGMQIVRIDSMALSQTVYGHTMIADTAEGFCYVYGFRNPGAQSKNAVYLARFPMNNIHSIWLYYSDGQWLNPPSSATPVLEAPAENVSIRKVKGKYLALTQDAGFACNQGNTLYGQVSNYPWGPFQNYKKLYTIKDLIGQVSPRTRWAQMHAYQVNAQRELLVTYTIDGYEPCLSTCGSGSAPADYYRVKTLRIPLQNFDPALK
ncbi:MAG: hypothetical protein JNM44_07590, partial [Chitinophagaceae bacterium]|nr:hypothetical protein [Chitinophagaceae bacterium]